MQISKQFFLFITLLFAQQTIGFVECQSNSKMKQPKNFKEVQGYPFAGMAILTKKSEIRYLEKNGFSLVVTLTPEPLDPALFGGTNVHNIHIPIEEDYAPTYEEVKEFLTAADKEIAKGKKVAVHCLHGIGRTGTIIATWLIARENMNVDQAIKIIKRHLSKEQKSFLRDFYKRYTEEKLTHNENFNDQKSTIISGITI